MSALAKRRDADMASLQAVPAMIANERKTLAMIASPAEAATVEKRAAAIVEMAKRAELPVAILNEATLLRVEALEKIADLVDAGQEAGEIANQGGDRKSIKVRAVSEACAMFAEAINAEGDRVDSKAHIIGDAARSIAEAMGKPPEQGAAVRKTLSEARKLRDAHASAWFKEQITAKPTEAVTISHAIRRSYRVSRNDAAKGRREKKRAEYLAADTGDPWIVEESDVRNWRPGGGTVIITDPPYVTDDALDLYEALGHFAMETLPETGLVVAMTSTDLLADVIGVMEGAGLSYFWTAAWVFDHGRDFTLDRRHNVYDRWKPIVLMGKGDWKPTRPFHDLIRVAEMEKDLHNWQQTLAGVADLVERFSDPGDLVLDPFTGTGTTGVACVQVARRFAGCDIDPEMVAIARGRISTTEAT